jgi:D-serine deaminase-like pyridoxal phosphate-dependent protein|tara:strand:+ start:751 stop:1230 length:480 start_codon:yes stop_codon:yes gene_type:complete
MAEMMDEMESVEAMANQAQSMGADMQAVVDMELPAIRGSFSQTAMNALVDAANMALEAAGFEGDYPEFDGDVTEFPAEFVRVLAMFADAAEETESGIVLSMDMIEDDRDVAALASKVRQLAESAEFKERMTAPMEAEVEVTVGPAGGPPDEEALMMERM